uniref:Hypothetical secreted protein n=1 Tax=Ornithodoros coriaceus TaxID=92741 RepID=B2D2E1_ORNCO|nr:hypothetical secreted protein precursor [Ornithodoros coriaceus]
MKLFLVVLAAVCLLVHDAQSWSIPGAEQFKAIRGAAQSVPGVGQGIKFIGDGMDTFTGGSGSKSGSTSAP